MLRTENSAVQNASPVDRVGPYTYEKFIDRVRLFHSYAAPGVVVGGIMVDMAMEQIPEGILYDVICETSSCLPDSVQLLTPCTVGNGWLKIVNLGRYAVSLYDKHEGSGVRVYLDPGKLGDWGEIRAWYLKLRGKQEQDSALLQREICMAGRSIYTLHSVRIQPRYLTRRSKGAISVCSSCGEAYPVRGGEICLGCQGKSPYESSSVRKE